MFQNHQEEHLLVLAMYNLRMNINNKYEKGKKLKSEVFEEQVP